MGTVVKLHLNGLRTTSDRKPFSKNLQHATPTAVCLEASITNDERSIILGAGGRHGYRANEINGSNTIPEAPQRRREDVRDRLL